MAALNPQTLVREGQSYFLTNVGTVGTPFVVSVPDASLTIAPANGVTNFTWTAALGQTSTISQDASGVTVLDETTPVLSCRPANTIIPQSLTFYSFGNPQGYITLVTTSVRTLLSQGVAGATVALTSDGKINTSNLKVGTTGLASVVLGPATNTNRAIAGPSRFAFGDGGMWQAGSTLNIDSSKAVGDHALQITSDRVNISTTLNTQDIYLGGYQIACYINAGNLVSTLGTKKVVLSGSAPSGYNGSLYAYDTATSTYADLTLEGINGGASISKSAISSPTNIFLTSQGAGKKVILNGAVKVLQPKKFWAYITSGDQLIPNATSVVAADSNTFVFSSAIRVDPQYPNVLSTPGGILKSQFEPPVNGVYEFTLTMNIMSPQPDPSARMLRWGANMAVYKTNYTPGQPSVSTFISYVLPMQTYSDYNAQFASLNPVYSYQTLTWTFVYPMIATATSYDTLRFIPTFVDSPYPSLFPTSNFQTRIGAGTTLAIRLL